jgi:hypothetical protein
VALLGSALLANNAIVAAEMPVKIVNNPLDVMSGQQPKLPQFPKLQRKAGTIRGYVKDLKGQPVAGAHILVIAPAMWGYGTGTNASGRTNANGLYEIKVPFAGAQVWCAGVARTMHGVRMALPLHPVDGELDNFSSKQGEVENFVLLPYGTASPSGVADNPRLDANYYGGSFTVGYSEGEGKGYFPKGSTIEITLTPDGPLMGGVSGRTFVIQRTVEPYDNFKVNNIPLGRYKISAKWIHNGTSTPLRIGENGNADRAGGLDPRESLGTATLLFRSSYSDEKTVKVPGGNMRSVELWVEPNK